MLLFWLRLICRAPLGEVMVGLGSAQHGRIGPHARRAGEADLAVNATTVGMMTPGLAFDDAPLPGAAAVCDLVYEPIESELLRRARAGGLRAANGLGMVVAQAEIAFERWTSIPARIGPAPGDRPVGGAAGGDAMDEEVGSWPRWRRSHKTDRGSCELQYTNANVC